MTYKEKVTITYKEKIEKLERKTVKDYKTPSDLLGRIKNNIDYPTHYTYVISGVQGPTGKTWLCNRLKEQGYKAVEISNAMNCYVDYKDGKNHVVVDNEYETVVIVLNRPLSKEEMGVRNIKGTSFSNPVSSSIIDMKATLQDMIETIKTYDCATVADLYALMNIPCGYICNKWGWSHLHGVLIKEDNDKFYIDFPEPKLIS